MNVLDNCLTALLRIFLFKNCLFRGASISKDSDQSKCEYNGYGIVFDRLSLWSLGNNLARNF